METAHARQTIWMTALATTSLYLHLRKNELKLHFKRLGSQVFHNLFNHHLCFFSKLLNRSVSHSGEFFKIFKRCSLDGFHKYKMSMGLYNGKFPVA